MCSYSLDEVVQRIIELTEQGKIKWEYLESNEAVCEKLKLSPEPTLESDSLVIALTQITTSYSPRKYFSTENSFIANIKDNYVILCAFSSPNTSNATLAERLMLMFVPRTFKGGREYHGNEVENGMLVKLHAIVKSTFPNVTDIIDDIFKM